MIKHLVSVATASGDTTKTKIGDVTIPVWAKRLIGVEISIGGAGFTTLEIVSGIVSLDSNSSPMINQDLMLNCGGLTTSGGLSCKIDHKVVDVPVNPNSVVSIYVTMDMALTVNNTVRVALVLADN